MGQLSTRHLFAEIFSEKALGPTGIEPESLLSWIVNQDTRVRSPLASKTFGKYLAKNCRVDNGPIERSFILKSIIRFALN